MKNYDENNAFQAASHSCYIYLKDKLNLPSKNLDPAVVKQILDNKLEKVIYNKLNDLLLICDEGKYSPDSKEKEKNIIKEMEQVLKQIDKNL